MVSLCFTYTSSTTTVLDVSAHGLLSSTVLRTLFVLYPNVRHARSRCSRVVSWVTTTTAVTFVVFETTF